MGSELFSHFACMYSFSVTEAVWAAGLFVHAGMIISDFLCRNYIVQCRRVTSSRTAARFPGSVVLTVLPL